MQNGVYMLLIRWCTRLSAIFLQEDHTSRSSARWTGTRAIFLDRGHKFVAQYLDLTWTEKTGRTMCLLTMVRR